jgi:BON domain-containing protein
VTLSGTVAERHLKRMAEDVAERCSGVRDVKNEIRVQRNDESGSMNQNQSKGKPNAGTGMKSSESKTA